MCIRDSYGTVDDWKSGAIVGAKAFGLGFYNGITGLVTEPYKGAKDEGTLGFCKGVGKGSLGLVSKSGTGKSISKLREKKHLN